MATDEGQPSSSGAVCEKDIVSTTSDFVGHPTPSGEVKIGHLAQLQSEERSPPHNAIATRPLPVADVPPPEDRRSDNSGGISCLDEDDETPPTTDDLCPTRCSIYPLSRRPLTIGCHGTDLGHGPDCTSSSGHLSASPAPDVNNLLALHLQMQPIPDRFQIMKMTIFGPALDPMGYVVNYNIHIDLRIVFEGLKCRAFPATLDEQGKTWFAFLTLGSITSFIQLVDLFEARRGVLRATGARGPNDPHAQDDVVRLTAGDIVNVFSQSIQSTDSAELKVAMCSAYIRIAKICPPHVWRPGLLVDVLCSSKPCYAFIDCIHAVVGILGPSSIGEEVTGDSIRGLSSLSKGIACMVGEKRLADDAEGLKRKRQKIEGETVVNNVNVKVDGKFTGNFSHERDKEYTDYMRGLLISFVGFLKPGGFKDGILRPETSLTALSMLCIVFCNHARTKLAIAIFQQMRVWIPWMHEQGKESSLTFDLSTYLEAVHNMLLTQSSLPADIWLFEDEYDGCLQSSDASSCDRLALTDFIQTVLKFPWSHSLLTTQAHSLSKTKCFSVQIFSKVCGRLKFQNLQLMDLALCDEAEEVRAEAIISLPVVILFSGTGLIPQVLGRMESLGKDKSHLVNKMCNKRISHNQGRYFKIPQIAQGQAMVLDFDIAYLHSLLFKLLHDESSDEVQVTSVGIISRVLKHTTKDILIATRVQWIQCIEYLLLHKKKAVRETFCTQISSFLEGYVLDCLFVDGESYGKTKEQKFLDQLKHALSSTEDVQILETLLESTAEIMNAVDIHGQLFLFALILLVDQLDNPHVILRMTASRLILRSCFFHLRGGFDLILSKFVHMRDELFDYLCIRLVSRPVMVREFAEAVVGIETEELIKRMIPIVLPKLVVSQQDNDQVIINLHELAKYLNTDLVPLTVNWLPKVLAFALLRADGQELHSALYFYHIQTGSDNKEIFSAALPALLEELVCFHGDGDLDVTNKR
ncbi:hypothetical protein ACLOJK_029603 [Asimina triloba]